MSWTDMSQEDAAEGDATSTAATTADANDLAQAATDPDTAVTVDGLAPSTVLGVPSTLLP